MVLSVIQGITLNTGVLPFSKGRPLQSTAEGGCTVARQGISSGKSGHTRSLPTGFWHWLRSEATQDMPVGIDFSGGVDGRVRM
jgi:hypothetical protein